MTRSALSVVLGLVSLLSSSCTPSLRSVEHTFHADTSFSAEQRLELEQAARVWTATTADRARFRILFDVKDDADIISHVTLGHQLIRRVDDKTPLSFAVDEASHVQRPYRVLAMVAHLQNDKHYIFFIDQRIRRDEFYSVAIHEFGHTLGMPDVKLPGSIMSGEHLESIVWPSPTDRALCKQARLCE